MIGLIGYGVMLGVSLVGVQPAWRDRPGPTHVLLAMSGVAVVYTAYLTYLEAVVINAWCRYCVVSSIVMLAIFVTAVAGTASLRRGRLT